MFSDLRQQLNFAFWSCWAVLSFHADLCNHITQPVQTETNEIGALYLRFSPGNFNFSSPGNEWLEFDKANMFPCLEHLGHLAHARCAPSNPPPPNKNHGKQMPGNCLVVPVALHPKCPHPVNLRDLNVGQWLVALFGWLVGWLLGWSVGWLRWLVCLLVVYKFRKPGGDGTTNPANQLRFSKKRTAHSCGGSTLSTVWKLDNILSW